MKLEIFFINLFCYINLSFSQEWNLNHMPIDINLTLDSTNYPQDGDIPVLNRKIFKGTRVTTREHAYVVSIRRKYSHYLTGSLITKNLVLTVAHPLYNVPINELGVVVGENYSDRGILLLTVIIVVIHDDFDPYTLSADIALLRYYEEVATRSNIKHVHITSTLYNHGTAIVTGWGRCDLSGSELCLPRSSEYYPDEKMDPMLRSISFKYDLKNSYCDKYQERDTPLQKGMICVGTARDEDPLTPCLAVPGAPLLIRGNLVALQSWGFGCGYVNDLPLVYTHIYDYVDWLAYNINIMNQLDLETKSVYQLFKATRAYTLLRWLNRSRKMKHEDSSLKKNLKQAKIDYTLAKLNGNVYDIRDSIYNDHYKLEKHKIIEEIRNVDCTDNKIKTVTLIPNSIIND